jgi:hypothetical protein
MIIPFHPKNHLIRYYLKINAVFFLTFPFLLTTFSLNKGGKNLPRKKTNEEIKKEFIYEVISMINYWDQLKGFDQRAKLEGLAYSILALLDGETNLPSFIVAPNPLPGEIHDFLKKDKDFYPENFHVRINGNISGELKDLFYKKINDLNDLKKEMSIKSDSEKNNEK